MSRLLFVALLLAVPALGGCAAILPVAIATEPLWAPAIESTAQGIAAGISQAQRPPAPAAERAAGGP